jgi:hypothetical protein
MGYLRGMRNWSTLLTILVLSACGTDKNEPCASFFKPYADIYSGTERTTLNAPFLDGLEHYNKGDHARAESFFKAYLEQRETRKIALLYLASSQLAQGRPFDAELQLDHLERANVLSVRDQTEWYTLLCWVCSGQLERALPEAERIAGMKRHTYAKEAADLVTALEP